MLGTFGFMLIPRRATAVPSVVRPSARAGTLFHRRSTDEATIICVLTLLAHGCPPAAIEPAFGMQRQTVRGWQDAAGMQSEAVHQHLVCQPCARCGAIGDALRDALDPRLRGRQDEGLRPG